MIFSPENNSVAGKTINPLLRHLTRDLRWTYFASDGKLEHYAQMMLSPVTIA
jgi:hypothetical protein